MIKIRTCKSKILLIFFGILFLVIINGSNFNYNLLPNDNTYENKERNLKNAGYWIVSPITIDGNSGWETANSTYDWITGSGSWIDPYVIENVTIDGLWSGSCIEVKNSDVYFIIQNCVLTNAGSGDDADIRLYRASNGKILNNTCSLSNRNGIQLNWDCNNNTVSNNNITDCLIAIDMYCSYNTTISKNNLIDNHYGVMVSWSDNITIIENIIIKNSGLGLYLISSNQNYVYNNIITNNGLTGMLIQSSDNNTIIKNTVVKCGFGSGFPSSKHDGVYIDGSDNNFLIENEISDNKDNSIYIEYSMFNTISKNIISRSDDYNIKICLMSYFNIVYENVFNSSSGGFDDGASNYWDNGTIGNYWADYTGIDTNDNGIGDTPYAIPGSAGSQDRYPIWWDSPVISINTPSTNDIFDNSPDFDISIDEGIVNTTWYTLDDGLTNITFTGLTGNIDQTEWIKRLDGPVIIKFFANDSRGYIGFTEVAVFKESIPQITINTPTLNKKFGFNAPEFNITVNDLSPINTTWYTIDGGLTNYTFSVLIGYINQTAWDQKEDGVITIKFYANDSLGNLGFKVVNVTKDITLPVITLISPNDNELFGIIAPNFNVEIFDINLDTMWYTLDNGFTNTTFTTNGTISQVLWDTLSNGTTTIIFYANDSAGNGAFSSVSIRVDKNLPTIVINSPNSNELFETTAPSFNVEIYDSNLDSIWYTLDNGLTNTTFTSNGTINQVLWDALPEGNVIIRVYANDTAGNIGFVEVTIRKDVTAPIIAINNPQNSDVIGATAPIFDISIEESNLDTTWYSLNEGNNITFTGLTGTINQALWGALPEGHVIIRFFANDSLGKIGFQEVTVVKTISQPSPPGIPGYNTLLLIGIVSTISVIIVKKRLNRLN